jgi:mannose-6-phosphate isomerase
MKYVEKPWGHERWLEVNDNYAMKVLHVKPGEQLSLQYHEEKTETMYCIDGKGHILLDDVKIPLVPGVHITVKPLQKHRLMSTTFSYLEVVECSTPELDDVVRLEDNYDRL